MCAFGPKQTFQSLRSTSAFGGKARSRVRRSQRQACCCLLAVQIEREAAEADHRTSPGRSAASEDRRPSRCRHNDRVASPAAVTKTGFRAVFRTIELFI